METDIRDTIIMLSLSTMIIAAAGFYWYLTGPMDEETRDKRFAQLKFLGL